MEGITLKIREWRILGDRFVTSAAFQIGIVIEIIDDSDFSRARKKTDERPNCMWENNNKRNARGDRKGARRIVEVEMHNWMKAWWTAEPRGSSYDWEGAECYNFKPDSHALFSVGVQVLSLSLSSLLSLFRALRAHLWRKRGKVSPPHSLSHLLFISLYFCPLTLRSPIVSNLQFVE